MDIDGWKVAVKGRWLKLGNCLGHAQVLTRMKGCPDTAVLCMAPCKPQFCIQPYLHCWIEDGEIAIDLTQRGQHCFERNEYYSRVKPIEDEIRRYTAHEALERGFEGGEWAFWDFDVTMYAKRGE